MKEYEYSTKKPKKTTSLSAVGVESDVMTQLSLAVPI